MRVLVACEFSGVVREAFKAKGHYAISCDFLPTEIPGCHHFGDVLEYLKAHSFNLMIAHPPCTYLASSGARWFDEPGRREKQTEAANFFMALAAQSIERIAIENPIGVMSTRWRKPDQIIQPWMFGHGEVKTTCLWLKGLPLLTPTRIVEGREQRCWKSSQNADRWKLRSRTYTGIASAMAEQWGALHA